jgi:hypothetical protein
MLLGPHLSQPQGPGFFTSDISGTWVLQQANDASEVDTSSVEAALMTPHVRGYSLRVPWSAVDGSTSLLDKGLQVARAHHLEFSIRFMAGRSTPARVFQAGAPSYTVSGSQVPTPFNKDGSPDAIFEHAFQEQVAAMAAWCRRNSVHILHLPWYGELWSEYYNGPAVVAAPGYSYASWLTAHEHLATIAWQYAGADLAIEFPLSGTDQSAKHLAFKDLGKFLNKLAAAHPTWLIVQTNGLGQPKYGMHPFASRGIQLEHAQQMFNGNDYDWNAIFNLIRAGKDVYVEIYVTSFSPNLPHHVELVAQVAGFD